MAVFHVASRATSGFKGGLGVLGFWGFRILIASGFWGFGVLWFWGFRIFGGFRILGF